MSDDIPMMLEREFGLPEHFPAVGVGFGLVPLENKKKSATAGHPVFEDREFVKIIVPGDGKSLVLQPASDAHKQRFPKAYAAFKNRESRPIVEGMLIEQWPQVTRAQAMTLRAANIPTVEALAEVSDAHVTKIGTNGRDLRAKAQAFVKLASDTAGAQKIASENQALKDQVAMLSKQVAELAAAQDKRRPRKEEAA